MNGWTCVAEWGERRLLIDAGSRRKAEGEKGALLHAAVAIGDDWREQTIWEPHLLGRRRVTLERRLRDWDEERLTPQRLVAP